MNEQQQVRRVGRGGSARRGLRFALAHVALACLALLPPLACSSGPTPAPPPTCDQLCLDGIALRGLRESMKLVYNLTLQGKPVGFHDVSVPCALGGTARIFGTATSNAVQGTTEVDLTYELASCTLLERDTEPEENYRLTVSGTVRQKGILAVQPSATTALAIQSDAMSISGTVYDPPVPYEVPSCPLALAQNGNRLTGFVCERTATTQL